MIRCWPVGAMILLLYACSEATATLPVPPTGPLRIMPLGDSITQGSDQVESYRRALWLLLQERGLAVDFVGSTTENFGGPPPHDDYDHDHEGHWGWTADQVLARVDAWAASTRPDIVLLHLGTNDIGRGEETAATVAEMAAIITALRRVNPRVTILLALVIPTAIPRANVGLQDYNAQLAAMGRRLHREDAPVVLVDLYPLLDRQHDFADMVHPNETGAAKMAQAWADALATLFVVQRP